MAQSGTLITGSSSSYPGYNDARAIGVFSGQVYGTDSSADAGWAGIYTLGSGLATAASSPPAALLLGFDGNSLNPWTFVFEPNGLGVWVADTTSVNSYK